MSFREKIFRVDIVGRSREPEKQIPVLPKNLRRIALHAIENIETPLVFMNKTQIKDFSDQGQLTQRGIRKCINFYIQNGNETVLGFHDHPNEMWISEKYRFIADHCQRQGWLRVQGPASERIIFKDGLSRRKLLLKITGETDPTEKSFIDKLKQLYRVLTK